jgi:hypothetical protein
MGMRPQPVEPRFWSNVEKKGDDECWEWTGGKDGVGYGVLCVNGKRRGAHRISLWLAGRMELDDPRYACHSCDNRSCVNPAHLWAGTNSDNIHDAYAKGRMISQTDPSRIARGDNHPARYDLDLRLRISERQRGEASHRAKITEADVRRIFAMRVQKMTQEEIASHFAVKREQIGQILRREKWGHLTGLPEIPKRRTCGAWQ